MTMNEPERPVLHLGEPPGRLKVSAASVPRGWLWTLLVLQLLILAVMGIAYWGPSSQGGSGTAGPPAQDAGQWKSLALELENRSLDGPAAEAWQQYLAASADPADRAEVLYRVGRLYLQAERYEQAASALVRCELAAGPDAELRHKVGPLLITCLRRMGRYGEVGRELSRQADAGGSDVGQGRVLATLAGELLTEADLDRMIERRIDQMLAMQGAGGDESLRQQLLQGFARPENRQPLFQELLQTELFTRRARELRLDQDPEFQAARQVLEDGLLASRLQERELAKIQPTEIDIQSYYQARQADYRQPESMQVLIEQLGPDDDPAVMLEGIRSADDFRQMMAGRRPDQPPGGVAPQPETLVRGRPHPRLGDPEPLFGLEADQWTAEPVANQEGRFLVLVENKTPARTPPLETIRERVQADYIARKRDESARRLFEEMLQRYNVQIHPLGNAAPEPSVPKNPQSVTP